jgi:hypothetical protein
MTLHHEIFITNRGAKSLACQKRRQRSTTTDIVRFIITGLSRVFPLLQFRTNPPWRAAPASFREILKKITP